MKAELLAGLALCLIALAWALDVRAEAQPEPVGPVRYVRTDRVYCDQQPGHGWICRILLEGNHIHVISLPR